MRMTRKSATDAQRIEVARHLGLAAGALRAANSVMASSKEAALTAPMLDRFGAVANKLTISAIRLQDEAGDSEWKRLLEAFDAGHDEGEGLGGDQ